MLTLRWGMRLLVLALPFAGYVAYQVQTVVRLDWLAKPSSWDAGLPSTEQFTANRVGIEKWATEVHTAADIARQFRPVVPNAPLTDEDASVFAQAAVARAATLADLEKFLASVERPVFVGTLKDRFAVWQTSKARLTQLEQNMEAWLKDPLPGPLDGPGATRIMQAVSGLIKEYLGESKFADSRKADAWLVQARVKVIQELARAAEQPYAAALRRPLPLPRADQDQSVGRAVSAAAAIREQARLLRDELARALERRILAPDVERQTHEALALADEWAGREEFLLLFADPELFTDPNRAVEWFPRVWAQFERTRTETGRAFIRKKVQEFCDVYIPKAVRLDEVVLIQGKPELRSSVVIEYDSDAKTQALTDRLDGLNEFNFASAFPNFDRIVWANGGKFTGNRAALQPTVKSLLARDFSRVRSTVANWSPDTINQLKMLCEGPDDAEQPRRRELTDNLIGTNIGGSSGVPWTRQNTRLWSRLSILSAVATRYSALFGD